MHIRSREPMFPFQGLVSLNPDLARQSFSLVSAESILTGASRNIVYRGYTGIIFPYSLLRTSKYMLFPRHRKVCRRM